MGRPRVDLHTGRPCRSCGTELVRKRYPGGDLEANLNFGRRVYCDRSCETRAKYKDDLTPGGLLQRQDHLRGYECETCGDTEMQLQKHHVDGNRSNHARENVKTLCASCHAKLHWREGKNGHPPKVTS